MDPPYLSPLTEDKDLLTVDDNRLANLRTLPSTMHSAPIFRHPFVTLEALGLLSTIRVDEWQHQDADLVDIYFELFSGSKDVLDELTRQTPMLTDEPKPLGSPQGIIFSSFGGSDASYTIDMADILPPPETVSPDLGESQSANWGIEPPFESDSDSSSHSDPEIDDGYYMANPKTTNASFTVSGSAPQSQSEDSDCQASVLAGGENAHEPAAPTNRQLLKRKRSSDPSSRPLKQATASDPSSSRTVTRTHPHWEDEDYCDEDTAQTDKEEGQRRATKKAGRKPKRTKKAKVRYACRISGCTRDFSRMHDRDRHEATASAHGVEKKYVCQCGRDFTRRDALQRHHNDSHSFEDTSVNPT